MGHQVVQIDFLETFRPFINVELIDETILLTFVSQARDLYSRD